MAMTPNEVLFGLITAAVMAFVIFAIVLMVRLLDAIKAMKQFCDTAEQAVKEAVGQINQDLRSLRKITDDVGIVTDNIGTFSGSIRDVGEGIGQLARNVREVGDLIQDLKIETAASMYGLRAGLKTGFEVFLKSLFRVGSAR
jgi:uncharacterized protein YoxC